MNNIFKVIGFTCFLIVTFSFRLTFSENADSTKKNLELQQSYIRSLVDQQKKEILNATSREDFSKELQASKIREMDSTLLKSIKTQEQQNASLKDATKVAVKKNGLRKTLIIGGLGGGAIAGTLAYFLTSGKSKSGADEGFIDDKPPLHP